MDFKIIENKKIWDDFVISCPFYTFLQSFNWGEIEKSGNRQIFRWGIYQQGKLIGIMLFLIIKSKRAVFGLIPHGPLFKNQEDFNVHNLKTIISFLGQFGKEHNLVFIRIGSLVKQEQEEIFKNQGLLKSPTHIYTDNFLLLDLSKSEDELLSEMRKTTRYLIKKAERSNIKIRKTTDIKKITSFYELLKKTGQRHHFISYPLQFLREEFRILTRNDQAVLFEAEVDKKILSAAIIVFFGNSAFYHHGASINTKIPVSYMLHWEVIKEAKKQGKEFYNFWGFAPGENKKHPFYGITIFKKGFGSVEYNCVSNYDLVIGKSYWFNYAVETVRKITRGH